MLSLLNKALLSILIIYFYYSFNFVYKMFASFAVNCAVDDYLFDIYCVGYNWLVCLSDISYFTYFSTNELIFDLYTSLVNF